MHQALDASAARWLLVFDNAPDHSAVAPFLPSGDGHMLIISRNPAWGGPGDDRRGLPGPDTAAEYLLARTFGGEGERAAAEARRRARRLPLALAQAGAYVDAYGEIVAGYLAFVVPDSAGRLLTDAHGPLDYHSTSTPR